MMKRMWLVALIMLLAVETVQAGWSLWPKKREEPSWVVGRRYDRRSGWEKFSDGTRDFFSDTTALFTGEKKKARPNPYVPWIREEVEKPWYERIFAQEDQPVETMEDWMNLKRPSP